MTAVITGAQSPGESLRNLVIHGTLEHLFTDSAPHWFRVDSLNERTLTLIPFLTDAAKLAPFEPRNVCRERQVLEAEAVNIVEVVINLSDM